MEEKKAVQDFNWLDRTIEGLLNDFGDGVSTMEETKNELFALIFDKLINQIQKLHDQLDNK